MNFQPSYLDLYEKGILEKRATTLFDIAQKCTLCAQNCQVDRNQSKKGKCKSGLLPIVSSYSPHFGEEPCLVGRGGSGTIFFTNCNLGCIFCQNYDISHMGQGREVSYRDLARMMLSLQDRGCHNINFVSPSHMVYAIVRALIHAVPLGLKLPLVYNTGGFDSVETIRLLDGIIDIYMPDMKYMNTEISQELSDAIDYPEIAMNAFKEMYDQVGDLESNEKGVAFRGLLVRHLVLPNNLAATDRVIEFLGNLSKDTYLNIMDQYRPEYRAREHFDLRRRITLQELDETIEHARRNGLTRVLQY